MSDWNKTEVITVPKGFYGWRTRGRLRYEDKVFRFPVGQATSLPAPVVEHLRKLIELPEEERPEQPHKYSANSTFTTDADGNPVWSPVDVSALTEELNGNGPHQMLVTGADGSTKWEDRTHWAESSEVMVVDETTITGSPGQFFVVSALKDDGEYTVLYNGVEYECVPKTDPSGDLALGNLKLAKSTLEDTGEPFLFTGMSTAGVTSYAFFADKTGTSTFSVSGQEIAIHPLDPKFLPEDYINELIDSKLGVIENGTY